MIEKLNLRASAMPPAFACPGSIREPAVKVRENVAGASVGTAAHAALRPLPEGRLIDWNALPQLASRYEVNVDELRMLVGMGCKLWGEVRESFPNARTEVPMKLELVDDYELTGTADVISVTPNAIRGADFKTGRKDYDYSHQMKAYGAMALLSAQDALTEATMTLLWIRTGEIENYTMTLAEAEQWKRRLISHVIHWDGTYYPGPHCDHCPRSHECTARHALVKRDMSTLLGVDDVAALSTMAPADIMHLYHASEMANNAYKRVHAALRQLVLQQGDVVSGDGKLTIQTEERRKIRTVEAWPILDDVLEDQLAECVTISLTDAEKLIAKRAGRGKGKAAIREANQRLQDAGALETIETKKLTFRRS